MGNGINLTAIFIANGMALLLAEQLLHKNNWRFAKHIIEYRFLKFIIYVSAAACIIDPIVFLADGHPGLGFWLIVYVGNMLLFIANILVGASWLIMVCTHLNGKVGRGHKILLVSFPAMGILALVINLFAPIVFSVDADSVYQRALLFWMFTLIEGIFILDGIMVHLYSKMKGGMFKFFPVVQFIIPVVIGISVQAAVYGVSLVYPAVIISCVGVFSGLRNEVLYMDTLTGLFNRLYLDDVGNKIAKKGYSVKVSALMLDVNDFKEINDKYGHAEGDEALIKVASILKKTVGALGTAIRYAGDEFVILLNTNREELVEKCISDIGKAFEAENAVSSKPYKLSVSVGGCSLDQDNSTLDAILSHADQLMYEEKKRYYSDNKIDRRRH